MTQLSNETAAKIIRNVSGQTAAEQRDLARRRSEDFQFMVLCESKRNMPMYHLFRDRSLDKAK